MNRSSIDMIENTGSLLMLTDGTTWSGGVRVRWTGWQCEINTCLKDFLSVSIIRCCKHYKRTIWCGGENPEEAATKSGFHTIDSDYSKASNRFHFVRKIELGNEEENGKRKLCHFVVFMQSSVESEHRRRLFMVYWSGNCLFPSFTLLLTGTGWICGFEISFCVRASAKFYENVCECSHCQLKCSICSSRNMQI